MFPKQKTRLSVLIYANIAIPLIIGGTVYVLSNDFTFISRCVRLVSPVQTPAVYIPPFMRNWGCDFLWAYSFTCLLLLLWPRSSRPYCIPVFTAILLGAIMEASQLASPAWCTFDWGDIAAQTIGSATAALIWRVFQKFGR